ncbi:MAG TPA: FkbM family methyltransferase [Thermoanaerobaculia bacterium]
MLRTLLERLSRGRVVRRRLPPEFGGLPLFVSPDASLKLWRRDLRRADPLLFALAAELVRPGAAIWDVGANVGLFALAASFRAGPAGSVLAVEPDAWLAALIERSIRSLPAHCAPVSVLSAAISDAPGTAEFAIAARGRATSHLASVGGSTQSGGARAVRQVPIETLDGLLARFPAPRLLKLDVEGAEGRCLAGAGRLLAEVRPAMLCEVAEENAAAVGGIFAAQGYLLFDAEVAAPERRPIARPVWNTLALPSERAAEVSEPG